LISLKFRRRLVPLAQAKLRSQIDIMANILNEAVEGTKKTRIMYRCNLSYKQLQSYIKLLLGMELLRAVSERKSSKTLFFETTEKGLDFLLAYGRLEALLA